MNKLTTATLRAALFATMLQAFAAQAAAPEEKPAAQDKTGQAASNASERFAKADTDGDGKLSRDEAKTGTPRLYRRFDRIDGNGDGFLTQEEIGAALGRFAARKEG